MIAGIVPVQVGREDRKVTCMFREGTSLKSAVCCTQHEISGELYNVQMYDRCLENPDRIKNICTTSEEEQLPAKEERA